MMIRSYGSSARGLHPGRIIVDDFLDESNLYSQEQRQKQIDYLHAVVSNCLLPNGSCAVTGTPFHNKDMYGDLEGKPGWKIFKYPAIFPDGSILWESRYNLQALLDKRASQGPIIFSREILCHPVTSDSTIFPYELIARSYNRMDQYKLVRNIQSFPRKFIRTVIGCDFAFSGNVGADYSCFVVVGVDDLNNYWLLHVYREKGKTYNEQMSILRRLNNDFRPDIIFVESNQAQTMFASGGKEAGMPVYGDATTTNKYDLRGGLPGLVLLFEQDKFRWPRGDEVSRATTDWLQGEFSSIVWSDSKLESASEHDDGVMAFWKAIRAANYIGGNVKMNFI
ncbi:MAG: hypothetical protein JHC54_08925 [Acinetobacter sp.]|nr:hypothetical protein [Acinetobacter sp.]